MNRLEFNFSSTAELVTGFLLLATIVTFLFV
jgi:hypothetical protein